MSYFNGINVDMNLQSDMDRFYGSRFNFNPPDDGKRKDNMDEGLTFKQKTLGILGCGTLVFLLIVILSSFGTVGAGERGVRTRFGAVAGEVGEGIYFKIPFVEAVRKMDVKIQKEQVDTNAASKDLQTVTTTVALNFHLNPQMAANVYQNVGMDYKVRLIDPALQEAVKASTANFTAEELITKREMVREDIRNVLASKLQPHGLMVDEFNIVNFKFSASFDEAIEAKVTAEQNALAAKNKLAQIEFEAQQAVAAAKGEAEAITTKATALKNSPEVLTLEALRKWNGVLPQVTGGGSIPFINVPIK